MSGLELEQSVDGDTAVLVVAGAVDASCAYDLYRAALTAGETDGVATVVLDLAGVEFLDSVGLGMLIRSRDELRDQPTPVAFALHAPSSRVADLLRITALTDEFRYA